MRQQQILTTLALALTAVVLTSVDEIVGLARDDAEKQYVLVVKRLTDTYGM